MAALSYGLVFQLCSIACQAVVAIYQLNGDGGGPDDSCIGAVILGCGNLVLSRTRADCEAGTPLKLTLFIVTSVVPLWVFGPGLRW